jgi:glycerophosphoryl diester phosphodiesterase
MQCFHPFVALFLLVILTMTMTCVAVTVSDSGENIFSRHGLSADASIISQANAVFEPQFFSISTQHIQHLYTQQPVHENTHVRLLQRQQTLRLHHSSGVTNSQTAPESESESVAAPETNDIVRNVDMRPEEQKMFQNVHRRNVGNNKLYMNSMTNNYSDVASYVPPIVIAHRGACGYVPEHTEIAYTLAIEMKADYIEFDVVSTKDHQLVVRHDITLNETTNVHTFPKFDSRVRTVCIDGECLTDYFVSDFTLAEIHELRCKQRLPFRNQSLDGIYPVLSLEQAIDIVVQSKPVRELGIYIETKRPAYHARIGLPLEAKLISVLGAKNLLPTPGPGPSSSPEDGGGSSHNQPVLSIFMQSFELDSLRYLGRFVPHTMFLMHNSAENKKLLNSDTELRWLSTVVTGLAPSKTLVQSPDPAMNDTTLLPPTGLVKRIHDAGMLVHLWTFRSDIPEFLAPVYHDNPQEEYQLFLHAGADGMFSDFADQAVFARDGYVMDHLPQYSQFFESMIESDNFQCAGSSTRGTVEAPIVVVVSLVMFLLGMLALPCWQAARKRWLAYKMMQYHPHERGDDVIAPVPAHYQTGTIDIDIDIGNVVPSDRQGASNSKSLNSKSGQGNGNGNGNGNGMPDLHAIHDVDQESDQEL